MAFTGMLGIVDSQLGNFQLASVSSSILTSGFTSELGISDSQLGRIKFASVSTIISGGGTTYTLDIAEVLTLIESAESPKIENIVEALILTEVVVSQRAHLLNVSETITISETVTEFVPQSTSDHLTFVETITNIKYLQRNIAESIIIFETARCSSNSEHLFETLMLSEVLARSVTYNLNIAEAMPITEVLQETREEDISEAITIGETLIGNFAKQQSTSDILTLAETVTGFVNKVAHDDLVITEDLTLAKIFNRNVNETLGIGEVLDKTATYNLGITEVLDIKGGIFRQTQIGDTQIWIPEVNLVVVPKKCLVILEVPSTDTAIVLPCPQMGDTEGNMNTMLSKRSMNNLLYSYIRKNELQKLKYTFITGRNKVLQLEGFLATNIAELINLINWKGEQWRVKITSSPFEATAKSLYDNEGEKYEFTLEFQGIRII